MMCVFPLSRLLPVTQGYSNLDNLDLLQACYIPAWRIVEIAFACSAHRSRCTSVVTPAAARVSIEIVVVRLPIGARGARSLGNR